MMEQLHLSRVGAAGDFQVAGLVDIGTNAHLEGVVLSQTAITLQTGASVNGGLLAQTTVDIDGSAVVEPGH